MKRTSIEIPVFLYLCLLLSGCGAFYGAKSDSTEQSASIPSQSGSPDTSSNQDATDTEFHFVAACIEQTSSGKYNCGELHLADNSPLSQTFEKNFKSGCNEPNEQLLNTQCPKTAGSARSGGTCFTITKTPLLKMGLVGYVTDEDLNEANINYETLIQIDKQTCLDMSGANTKAIYVQP